MYLKMEQEQQVEVGVDGSKKKPVKRPALF
jgi:hypothetical protein